MARRIRYSELETPTARERLRPAKHHWRALDPGKLSLGYLRKRKAVAGVWLKRSYVGVDERNIGRYKQTIIAVADDFADADGVNVLSFGQAQLRARDQDRPSSPLTVREAVDLYIEFLRSRGQNTNDTRRRADVHIIPQLGEKEVEALTSAQIRKWLADHAAAPALVRSKKNGTRKTKQAPNDDDAIRRRRSSANRVLTILKAALNHAYDEGKVSTNDAWGRRVKPFRSVDVARIRFLSLEEATRLLNACEPDFRRLVRGALETGARFSELGRLMASDFSHNAGTLHVRKSKSGHARHIILTPEAVAFFRDITAGRAGDALIFTHANGAAWKASQQRRPMIEAVSAAKIAPSISFHGLRHTYASHCVMGNVPLLVVAKNLGHATVNMVQKHYAHLAPSYEADAIRAGAPRFDGKETNVTLLPVKRAKTSARVTRVASR